MSVAQDPIAPIAVPAEPDQARIARGERLRLLLRSPTFIIGSLLFVFWAVCALFGNQIAPQNPQATDVLDKLASPSSEHYFGTDRLGRDVLSRVIVGARSVLLIASLATVLGTILGTALGLISGYFRGMFDEVVMRIVDAFLSLPVIIIALVAIAAVGPEQGSGQVTLILVIGFIFSLIIAKTVRAAVLGEAQLEYVQAARLRNEMFPYILFAEILPNVMGPVIVEFTVRLGYAIFAVATLSFLGFGADPSIPDWGLDISEHYTFINGGVWWAVLFPSLAIASLIVAINLVADTIAATFER
jgi:peptide/nickel transport system permease protein